MSDYFRHMHIPPDLGDAFMSTFTRMEYALKASKEFAGGDATGVVALWDKFANQIDAALYGIKDETLQTALKFLLDEPARKEILTGFGPLYFDPNQTKTQRVLLVVRTVRNNIFHGGKIQPAGEKEKGRNEKLVGSSLTVLEHAAGLYGEVSKKFHEAKS